MLKLISFLLLLPAFSIGQKNYPAMLDGYMGAQSKINNFNGNVLVAKKGKIIYQNAFGIANREFNIPNAIDTRFRIGSITKQFTAAAILQLAEEGKLSVSDKLTKYFPGYPKADSVTIHMLLNHTSGIRNYTALPNRDFFIGLPYPKDSTIELFKNQPYDFSPGTRYSYSNSGYFLLGQIIEKASGRSYEVYINNMVQKAGLKNTGVNRSDTILPNSASGYVLNGNKWKASAYWANEMAYSAGAMFSTVQDLHLWQKALFSGKIISPASLAQMTTPYLGDYGYGLHIITFLNDKHIGHGGGFSSFNSYIAYLPNHDISVVVLSNTNAVSSGIARALATIILNKPVANAYKHQPVKIDPQLLGKYEGKYQTWDGITMELIKKGDKFYRKQGSSEIELQPESPTQFFYTNGRDIQIKFTVNHAGEVVDATLINHGVATGLKKL